MITSLPLHCAKRAFMLLTFLLAAGTLSAKKILVKSIAELQTAINSAAPGDVITLANGVYTTTEDITIQRNGTAAQPITITTEKAEITGAGGFKIVSPSSWIVISGFKFTHAANKAVMEGGTTFCRWTRNTFINTGEGNYLTVIGNDHTVDYNTFQDKNSLGKFIGVRGTGKQIAERLWIHHNYFHNFSPQKGNGAEAVQFGLSGYSLSSSNSIFEYNLFENCAGENELLSVKSSAVTIRYNTIRDCKAQFTLRHGNFCKVYGNYFYNTPGLRIFGDDHIIYSNFFENCKPAINVGNGGAEVADGAPLTSHDRPDRVVIAFNTLLNNEDNITRTERKNGIGSTFITIAYNIIQGGGEAMSIQGPLYENPTFKGNVIFNTKGAGQLPASGYTTFDPKLTKDGHLQKGSPAIDAVKEGYPGITADMDGQERKGALDLGADEVSVQPVKARMLHPADVGCNAK